MKMLNGLSAILIASLIHITAWADPCEMQLAGKLPVTVEGGKILIDGAIDGTSAKFILDTGAGASLLDPKSLPFSIEHHVINGVHVYGMNGEAATQALVVKGFQLGSFKAGDVQLMALISHSFSNNVYDLIGLDILSKFNVELDVADGVVNLFVQGRCPGRQVYWSSAFSTADIDFASTTNRHVRLPVTLNDRHFTAMLDSGTRITYVDKRTATLLGYDDAAADVHHTGEMSGLDGKKELVDTYRFDRFLIADEEIAHPLLAVSRISGAASEVIGSHLKEKLSDDEMILGLDFIKAHRIFIDFDSGHIYFNYLGGPVFEQPKIMAEKAAQRQPVGQASALK